ncbi:McrB family protein [Psychrobacter sp. M13]|uniref:McrB family protein n=1 Tax=Psychrobacter sp. M13 TaxID=3067275 RepID=UPI00273C6ADE|nr:AAA family ATPase [Psychrobacter sp. M13]WLP94555.1 AAA family ATPase [Psychrobacter sp. M13]
MEQIVVRSDDYNSESQVTKEEWLKILSDDTFMTNNYKYALSIFFLEPDHKATCKFLADKYHTSPFSISGFITGFSRAVQERLNRFEITTEEGDKTYWLVTMLGTKVSGKLFEWKLRDELAKAMRELDYISNSAMKIDSIGHLVSFINQDIGGLKKDFLAARKELVGNQRITNSKLLFKYDSEDREWAINEGAGTEVQYHIYLSDNKIGYGLGFNTLYVRFKEEKTPVEYIKPFMDAFIALKDSNEVAKLANRGFKLNTNEYDFQNPVKDEHYLFGRIVELDHKQKLSLVDYYSIINDLKGDLFEAYKNVFKLANKTTMNEQASNSNAQLSITNPLLQEVSELLLANKNLILTGAPGTGKTYIAKEVCKALGATYELVQFHPSYDYTDFVEGLRPVQNENGEVGFELRDGIFKAFCKEALKTENHQVLSNFDEVYHKFIDDVSENGLQLVTPSHKKPFRVEINSQKNCKVIPDTVKQTEMAVTKQFIRTYLETDRVTDWKPYLIPICEYVKANYDLRLDSVTDKNKKFVIILDEINRAEISKVLGELFFSIDSGYRGKKGKVKTQYTNLQTNEDVFKDGFYVPENVYIIGTMNDIDRSVESFDFAMRRRFAWREIKAKDRLSMWDGEIDEWIEEAKARLNSLNGSIESIQGLNSAYHVGPAYFLKLTNYDGDFEALWMHHLQSLLFEYLRGYPDSEQQLEQLKNAYDMVDYDASND